MKRSILAVTFMSVLAGCSVESDPGPEDPGSDPDGESDAGLPDDEDPAISTEEYCMQFAEIICTHTFTCMTAEERAAAGAPPTEAECLAYLQEPCPTSTSDDVCNDGKTYHGEFADQCVTEFAAMTCEAYLEPDMEAALAEHAPSCLSMCQ